MLNIEFGKDVLKNVRRTLNEANCKNITLNPFLLPNGMSGSSPALRYLLTRRRVAEQWRAAGRLDAIRLLFDAQQEEEEVGGDNGCFLFTG